MGNKLGFQWKLGYDASQNELIYAAYLNTTGASLIYFRDGETLKVVEAPRERMVKLNTSGPIK